MSTLKELRTRIKSVTSTQKITSAMKMVASAKLRRAQENINKSRPYAKHFKNMAIKALTHLKELEQMPVMITGTAMAPAFILGIGSDRGLCGAYNANVVREMIQLQRILKVRGVESILFPIGRKIGDLLASHQFMDQYSHDLLQYYLKLQACDIDPDDLCAFIIRSIEDLSVGSVYVVTGHFKSILSQPVETLQLIPLDLDDYIDEKNLAEIDGNGNASTIFEPEISKLLPKILQHNLKTQIKMLILENSACEHAARMTAMDNASRNARDMIATLKLRYNQGRQTQITNELIEILSGASECQN